MAFFSEAADRNKTAILDVISDVLKQSNHVLEVGTGTGQHALYFADQMPHLIWHATDFGEYLVGLKQEINQSSVVNVQEPTELDVRQLPWSQPSVDLVYSANTLHIMGWNAVEDFFVGVDQILQPQGHLVVYGPFKYSGDFTSSSNADFDLWLKDRDPVSGIRDFEAVNQLANNIGLKLVADHSMPANNQCLIWLRKE